MAEGDTLPNAVIGALAAAILFFLPFSTVLGGAVAGYLQGGDRNDGLKVGAVAGVIMLVPFLLFGFLVGNFFFFSIGVGPTAGFAFIFLLFAAVLGLFYVVGFAALGGYLGNYVRYETDVDV